MRVRRVTISLAALVACSCLLGACEQAPAARPPGYPVTPHPLSVDGMKALAPGSLDATAAAEAMLDQQARDLASLVAQADSTNYLIEAERAGAKKYRRGLSVGGLIQICEPPAMDGPLAPGTVSVDTVRPTDLHVVLVEHDGTRVSSFLMRLDRSANVWRYRAEHGFSVSQALSGLQHAAGGKAVDARRFVWVDDELSWWVVRMPGVGDAAVPYVAYGTAYVEGRRVERRLYPASVIRAPATSVGPLGQ
jgi:hypothetical protein